MKTNQKILTILFAIIILSTIGSALNFTQSIQSETVSTISTIKTTGTYAMAYDGSIILLWNSTEWSAINFPSGEANPLLAWAKASDKNFYFSFGTNESIKTYRYTPSTNNNCPSCWSLQATTTPTSTFQFVTTGQDITLACVEEGAGYSGSSSDAECYLLERNSTFEIRGKAIIDSVIDTTILTASTSNGMKMLSGTRIAFSKNDGTSATLQEWTGVTFTQQVSVVGGTNVVFDALTRANANVKAYSQTSATGSLYDMFNSTSGTYPAPTNNFPSILSRKLQLDSTATKLYSITGRNLTSTPYVGTQTFTQEFQNPAVSNFATFDTDWTTGAIWIAGNSGLIYYADLPNQNTSSANQIIITVDKNPVVYGQAENIAFTNDHTGGLTASFTVSILNSTGFDVYGTSCSISNGATCDIDITGSSWTNFQPNQNYTITVAGTWSDASIINEQETLYVIVNATTTQTNYTLSESTYFNSQITSIKATARSTNNNGYFTGNNGTNLIIASADSNDMNNLLVKTKQLTGIGGADYSNALDQFGNSLFYGTNNDLFQFTNATQNNAQILEQDSDSNGFFLSDDYIQSITTKSAETSWVCRKGSSSDDANEFNFTDDDFTNSISVSPCKAIVYYSGRVYVHTGATGLKIYNETDQSLITSITTGTYPSTNNDDMISISDNKLAFTSATNKVRIYDLTNPSSPTYQTQCLIASNEIRAIELLDSNTLIIGTNYPQLRVCDLLNNATYDATNVGYATSILKSYTNSEVTYEIEKLDGSGKFQVAEGNRYSVYQYTSQLDTIQINNPPTITEIYTPVTSVCYGEILNGQILASDPDGDELTYDYACEGVKISKTNSYITNTFSCSYTSGTSKTIKAFTSDDDGAVVSATKIIAVSNCTASPKIEIKILDGLTSEPVTGVTAILTGEGTTTSDEAGIILFTNLSSTTTYTLTLSKAGYFTSTQSVVTSPSQYITYLEPTTSTTGQTITTLIVNVVNSTGSPISDSLVSVTEPITGASKYVFSNAVGTATLTSMFSTSKGILSGGKTGYFKTTTQYFTLASGEQKTITLTLLTEQENFATGRGCQDYISGVVLCSPLRIDQTGDSCTADADCLTGRCEAGNSASFRKCAKFNWTQCDAIGMDRGNKCVAKFMASSTSRGIGDVLLDNFLYVLILIVLFIMGVMLLSAVKGRN